MEERRGVVCRPSCSVLPFRGSWGLRVVGTAVTLTTTTSAWHHHLHVWGAEKERQKGREREKDREERRGKREKEREEGKEEELRGESDFSLLLCSCCLPCLFAFSLTHSLTHHHQPRVLAILFCLRSSVSHSHVTCGECVRACVRVRVSVWVG